MQITPLIQHLRTTLPSWGNRIAGSAEYEAAEDKARLPLPSMFVMYAGSQAKTISHHSTFEQALEERFKVLVVLPNEDRTGKKAQDNLHAVRTALFAVLLNYQYDPNAHTLEFIGDAMVEMDKARYFHQFEFKQISRLCPDDGAPLVLEDFDRLYADWNLLESTSSVHPDAQDHLQNLFTLPE